MISELTIQCFYFDVVLEEEYRVREIVLSLAGHYKLFAGHLIEFNSSNSSSSPDISKIGCTCPVSPANFAYSVRIRYQYQQIISRRVWLVVCSIVMHSDFLKIV